MFLTAVRHEVNNLESSVVVQELELAINLALYLGYMSQDMRLPTLWYVQPFKGSDRPAHTGSLIKAFASRLSILSLLSYLTDII